jgi:UDP-3-O-[3-hydroxymyristoyl] glucosamine N-acyltransferase
MGTGIASGNKIESGSVLLGKTGVNRDLEKGTYIGMFAEDFKTYLKKEVKLRNLK